MARLTLHDAVRQFWSHASPRLLAAILLVTAAARLSSGEPLTAVDALIMIGIHLYWPFQEWWMHRWLLHADTIRIGKFTWHPDFALKHRLHHQHPEKMEYTLLPLPQIVIAGVTYFTLGWLISGSLAVASTLLFAATLSTLAYEWTHYLTHTNYKAQSSYYRKIWKLHRWHHYKNEHYWFSFTVPFIDGWLGTGPKPGEVPKSETVRLLDAKEAEV